MLTPFNAAALAGALSVVPLLAVIWLRLWINRAETRTDIGMGIPFRLRDSGEE